MLAAFSLTGSSYAQNFDGLGTTTGTAVTGGDLENRSASLAGWFFAESGKNATPPANTTITAGTGSSTNGDTYNFGAASGPTQSDRALGGLRSTNLVPSWGFQFTNNTGGTITSLAISYRGETWRVGATNRSDRIDFQYSPNATSLTTGTWTDVDALDYANPGQGTTASGSVLHSATVTGTITGLTVANGGTFFMRWADFNPLGSDDGMGVDDFSLTVNPGNTASITPSGTAAGLSTTYGVASTASQFTVSGNGLTTDITAAAPTGFEVSSDGATFAATAKISQTGGVANGVIRVRLAATAPAGTYASSVVTLSSVGAASRTVAIGSSSVAKAAMSITAADVLAKVGSAPPSGPGSKAFTASGLVGGQTVGSVTITLTQGTTTAGTFPGAVVPSAATGGTFDPANYTVQYVGGRLVVTETSPITVVGAFAALTTTYGTASSITTVAVSAAGLTGPITATAPAGFEVSSDGATFGTTATFAVTAGSASGTLTLRLAATAPAGTRTGGVGLASPGVAFVTVPVAASTVLAKGLTIAGLVAQDKDFDGTTAAVVTGTPTYVGLVNGESFVVTGTAAWAFPDALAGTGKTLVLTGGYAAPSANYTVTPPTLTATIRPATSVRLFSENFAALTTGNSTSTSGSNTAWSGSANWSSVTRAYQAGGAVKLGTSSAAGSIVTKTLDLTGNGGVFTVSFAVKGWTTVEGNITVTVTGLAPQTVTYTATMSAAFQTRTLQFAGGTANATITFATTAGRAFLDDIVVDGGTPSPVTTGIGGFVWNDADGDGVWDQPDETGIGGRTVYLDLDRDGAPGVGEPTTVTAVDGSYEFLGLAAGTYIVAQVVPEGWEQTSPAIVAAQTRSLAGSGVQVATFTDPAYMPVERQQGRRFVPNDPLFAQQWHLQNTGQKSGTAGEDARLGSAWDVARGTGVVIGIVDDGLERTHPDLQPAYRADLSYDFNDNDTDPSPGTGDDHGTAAAGVAAARGNNGIGVSGSAPAASLAGIRLISAVTTDQQEANGLTYKPQDIAVYSNSWGPNDDGKTLEAPGPLTRAALANAVQTGRGGKGSIYVWAAGNGLADNDNSNYDGYANSRYTIAVTAVDNRGEQSWYAEPGANILVAAPSSGDSSGAEVGIVTVDRAGSAGYNVSATASPGNLSDRNYTNDYGGTSSATPLVSGVVALVLEANPGLGWRDVQHILAKSARRNDVTDADWRQNAAGMWVNHKYGFGVVDAAAAVNLAKTWTNVGAEASATSGTITVGSVIPDNSAAGITSSFTLGADIRMESVEIVFSATHASRGNLQVVLTSPSGTKSVLAEKHADTGANYSGWVFSTVRNWDESSKGTWSLTVSDLTAGTTGTFGSWAINVYGTALPAPPGSQTVAVTTGQVVAGINFGTRSTQPATNVAITGAVDDFGILQGMLASGAVTDDTSVVLNGTLGGATEGLQLETGGSLKIYDGSTYLGKATVTTVAGGQSTWTYADTRTLADGAIPSFTAKVANQAGSEGTASAVFTLTIDTLAPTVVVSTSKAALTMGQTATITFTLSEESVNFAIGDVAVTGGSLADFAKDGADPLKYTATFTPAASSTTPGAISVAASTFTDAAGNANPASNTQSISIDTKSPTVSIATSSSALKIGETATVTFTLSKASSDFVVGDVTVTGGTLAGFAQDVVNPLKYTATFTPTANSTVAGAISVAAGTFADADGVANAAGSLSPAISIDTQAPTVSIATSSSALKIGETASITFTLSEPSSNFVVGDVTVAGGTLAGFAKDGIDPLKYTATFTPTASSTVAGAISVTAGRFTDAAGNDNTAGSLGPAISIDTQAPTVSITAGKPALKIGETASITFMLSEPSSNFVVGDVTVAGGTLAGFAKDGGDPLKYTATFTPTANSTVAGAISVAAGTFTDAAGNDNTAGSLGPAISIDTQAPTVSITTSSSALKLGATATITFTLSEESSDFEETDITVAGGTLADFEKDGTDPLKYAATFTPTANSTVAGAISVAASKFTDAAGNVNTASNTQSISIDSKAPTVSVSIGKSALKIGETAPITFTLSETSSNFDVGDVTVTGGTLAGFAKDGVDPLKYTATFTPTANSTVAGAISVAAGTFTDAAGNDNTASNTQSILIDTQAPTVSISTGKSALKIGETAPITFMLSETSSDFVVGDVTVTGGTLTGFAKDGGDPLKYTATFTPTANSTVPGAISVAAGTFTDAAGNANATGGTLSIPVDTVAPTIAITRAGSATLKIGETAVITFTLGEPSTKFAVGAITTSGGTLSGFAAVSSTVYTATFTPATDFAGLATIAVNAATFTDAAGNANAAATPLSISIDTVAPRLLDPGAPFSVNPGLVRDLGAVQRIPLSFTMPVRDVTVGSFRLWLNGVVWPLQGARIEGAGQTYTLVLPVSRMRPTGIYRLEIAPTSTIRATANNALASSATSIFWGTNQTVGMAPNAPSGLSALLIAPVQGKLTASLTWQPPAGNGGGPVTEYLVDYRIVGASTWLRVRTTIPAAPNPRVSIQGLVAGRNYEFRVAARNSAGVGQFALTQLFVLAARRSR